MKAPHVSSSLFPVDPHLPLVLLVPLKEQKNSKEEGPKEKKDQNGTGLISLLPLQWLSKVRKLSSRLSMSVEMCCIYADTKNKNYKEAERGKERKKRRMRTGF